MLPAPVANFTASPTSGTNPLTVTFTDTSTNSPTSWAWTFGDGGTSTLKSPSHQYTTAGTYTVTLKATNAAGNNTLTRTNYIKVNAPATAPVANFTASPTSGTNPLTVTFTDTSTNSPTSWAWTFGDGGTSTLKSPSHQYTTAGTYTVTLKATNAAGNNTLTRTNYIKVNAPAPVLRLLTSLLHQPQGPTRLPSHSRILQPTLRLHGPGPLAMGELPRSRTRHTSTQPLELTP